MKTLRERELKAAGLENYSALQILKSKPYLRHFSLLIGLSPYLRSAKEAFWNRITILQLVMVSLAVGAIVERGGDVSSLKIIAAYRFIVGCAAFLMWMKLIGFLQNTYKEFSIYVGMIIGIIRATKSFIALFLIIYVMFCHVSVPLHPTPDFASSSNDAP